MFLFPLMRCMKGLSSFFFYINFILKIGMKIESKPNGKRFKNLGFSIKVWESKKIANYHLKEKHIL